MIPTLPIDRKFRGVGRIAKASGTTDPKVLKKMNACLTDLYGDGRLDILNAIRMGELSVMEVYAAWLAKDLGRLPLGIAAKPLHATYATWLEDASQSEANKASRKQGGVYLKRFGSADARVNALPEILLRARGSMAKAGHEVTFNLLKSAAQAFVRDTMGKGSALYRELQGIARFPAKTTVVRRPMTPRQLWDICLTLDDDTEAAAWAMAQSGMGPGEFWGSWELTPAYIHIHGTKRAGRDRKVPLVRAPFGWHEPPTISRQVFEDRLTKAGEPFKPYDLRRSYANWLEAAGIPRTRRMRYLGHGVADTTAIYEQHEVLAYIAEDTAKLRAYLDRELARPTLSLEKDG